MLISNRAQSNDLKINLPIAVILGPSGIYTVDVRNRNVTVLNKVTIEIRHGDVTTTKVQFSYNFTFTENVIFTILVGLSLSPFCMSLHPSN